jgi:hypothetical protein
MKIVKAEDLHGDAGWRPQPSSRYPPGATVMPHAPPIRHTPRRGLDRCRRTTVGFISSPVSAAGTQIQPLNFAGPFTGTMEVLTNDGMNASFSVSGMSTTAEDNSAPFLGVASTKDDITGLRFFADIGNPAFPEAGNVAINQVDVVVSEPGSAPVLGAACLLLLLFTGLVSRRFPVNGGHVR